MHLYVPGFRMFLKFDMNSEDANSNLIIKMALVILPKKSNEIGI